MTSIFLLISLCIYIVSPSLLLGETKGMRKEDGGEKMNKDRGWGRDKEQDRGLGQRKRERKHEREKERRRCETGILYERSWGRRHCSTLQHTATPCNTLQHKNNA